MLSLFIAESNLGEQTFWLQQQAEMDNLYQREKNSSVAYDKEFPPELFHAAEAKAIDQKIKTDKAQNLNQLQALCNSFDRSETKDLLMFLILQFSLLGGYLTLWYFIRNPNAQLLALMIKLGHKHGTLFS